MRAATHRRPRRAAPFAWSPKSSRSGTLLRKLAHWASGRGTRARLSILVYHRVLAREDPLDDWDPTAAQFEEQVRALASLFTPIALGDAVARLRGGALPPLAACVTFDDGYRDNVEVALPILRRYGVPATFFIATGYLDGGRMWNDTVIESLRGSGAAQIDLRHWGMDTLALSSAKERREAIERVLAALKHLPGEQRESRAAELAALSGATLSRELMMRDTQVRALRDAGMEIGAHSVTHPILTRLSPSEARREIVESRERLEAILGEPVSLFAYPNGKPGVDYSAEHVRMVREAGFRAAVSTAWGAATVTSDVLQLPRFTPWDRRAAKFALRLLVNRRNTRPALV